MAYIAIEFGGKKTFGGYLSVDGAKQMVLSEGLMIKVEAGTHYLNFMNVPKANKTIFKGNVLAGNWKTAYVMANTIVEGDITEELGENDLLTLTVVSGDNGQILGMPQYEITTLSAEGMLEADKLYRDQAKEGIQADGSNVNIEFWLCLFLGWLGIHKFYRGKTFLGIIYMFTLGFFLFGWILDTLILLIKKLRLRKV